MTNKSDWPATGGLSQSAIANAFGLTRRNSKRVKKLGEIPRAEFDVVDPCDALAHRIKTLLKDEQDATPTRYTLRHLKLAWHHATPTTKSEFLKWLDLGSEQPGDSRTFD